MLVAAFLDEARSFDTRFVRRMPDPVAIAQASDHDLMWRSIRMVDPNGGSEWWIRMVDPNGGSEWWKSACIALNLAAAQPRSWHNARI
jgi:hypothetical protein